MCEISCWRETEFLELSAKMGLFKRKTQLSYFNYKKKYIGSNTMKTKTKQKTIHAIHHHYNTTERTQIKSYNVS